MNSSSIMLSVNDQGIIENIPYFPSPNFNERPPNTTIDLLIIHNITVPPGLLKPENVRDLFLNQLNQADDLHFVKLACLRVSAHLLITREGKLWQFVPLHLRAWHAGDSCYQKRKNCNDYSIGIELLGADDLPYTEEQYYMLVKVTRLIQSLYPAVKDSRIVGHSDVAPGRKTDPGPAFDWCYFRQNLVQE